MKRFLALGFVVFWGIGVFFLILFFTNLRSSYRSKANLTQNTVLRILPILADSGQNLTPEEIDKIATSYRGLIVRADDLNTIKALSRSFRTINPEFKLYLQVSFSQKEQERLPFATLIQNQDWVLSDNILDIRDPLYRQAFFEYWQTQLNETKTQGLYLTSVHSCPPTVSDSVCQAQYSWWEMSTLDFMAQIRQYFSEQTILVESLPISDNQEEFTRKVLPQSDGMVFRDFAVIYNDENTFLRYYQFVTNLLQDPQNLEKQLIFTVTADPSLQRFFQASYLLFANEFSSYYFNSGETGSLNWQTEWEQEFQPSLNPAIITQNNIYQRELGNALILVNPGLSMQSLVLDQKLLQTKTGRVWQDQPVKFQDSLNLLPKSGLVINLLTEVETSVTQLPDKIAEWSDNNSAVYSNFENQYLLRNTDSLLLGNMASVEPAPKNYDDNDDGIKIDGLEAGIFNLSRGQTYTVQADLANVITGKGELEIWLDFDGRGSLLPERMHSVSPLTQTKISFNLTIPDNAGEFVFLRAIVKDTDKGEIEDYILKVQ